MRDEPSKQRDAQQPRAPQDVHVKQDAPAEHTALRRLPALPRRSAQRHLEAQLREPHGAGWGTPFAAFDPTAADQPAQGSATPAEEPDTAAGTRSAEFRRGAGRGRSGA